MLARRRTAVVKLIMEEALDNTHATKHWEVYNIWNYWTHMRRWGRQKSRSLIRTVSLPWKMVNRPPIGPLSGVPGTRTKNESWVWKRPKRGQGSVSHHAEQVEERWLKKVSQLEKSVKEPENEIRMVTRKREATQKPICWPSSCLKWRIKSWSRAKISWEVLCDTKVFPRGISCDGAPREDNLEAGIIK